MQYLRSLLVIIALVPGIAGAEGDHPYCGTTPNVHEVIAARSDAQMRRLARQLGVKKAEIEAQAAEVTVTRVGEIAVLQADETLVSPANPFDLSGRAIRFMRRAEGFAVGREKPGFARPIGKRIDLSTFDSRRVEFDHGATFPFGDEVYSGMWINSSGNLTFVSRDFSPSANLESLVGGQPRIAPLLQAFEPQTAPGKGGIYYWVDKKTQEIRVTWFKVPLLLTQEPVSFQVRLRPDGRITFAYDRVPPADGVVGIFPSSEGVRVIDLRSELPAPAASGAVAEQFSVTPELNHIGFSRAFLDHFEDRYDYVTTWFDFPLNVGFFFHAGVRNDVRGIGRQVFDQAEDWGSGPGGQMKSYLFMNSLDFIPDDPDEVIRDDSSPISVIEILGHEAGHRWCSFTRIRDPRTGEQSDVLLGRQRAHWSFNMHTNASVMEGNTIADNGDGTFTTTDAWVGYSDLDLYLMGFQPPSSVSPFFFVDDPDNPRERSPEIGVELSGERVDVTLEDIIAVEGERMPASDTAPRDFRMAFILVTPPGEEPREGSLAKLDAYRLRWEDWWAEATGGGSFDTTLEDPLR